MRLYELHKRQPVDQMLPPDDHKTPNTLPSREPWRGPHEGRYLRLMLNGTKPAALVDIEDLAAFRPYIIRGDFVADLIDVFENTQQYVVTLSGEAWRIPRLKKLYEPGIFQNMPERLWHAKVGILLGYTNDDIRKFINQDYYLSRADLEKEYNS